MPSSRTEKSFFSKPSTRRPLESFTVTGTTTKLPLTGRTNSSRLSVLRGGLAGLVLPTADEGAGVGAGSGDELESAEGSWLGSGEFLGAGAVPAGNGTGRLAEGASGIWPGSCFCSPWLKAKVAATNNSPALPHQRPTPLCTLVMPRLEGNSIDSRPSSCISFSIRL